MTFLEFVSKIFQSRSGVSSKRICGFLGWLVCIGICIYCTICAIPAPQIIEMLFVCSTSLLGIDSVAGIWKKEIKSNENTNKNS